MHTENTDVEEQGRAFESSEASGTEEDDDKESLEPRFQEFGVGICDDNRVTSPSIWHGHDHNDTCRYNEWLELESVCTLDEYYF